MPKIQTSLRISSNMSVPAEKVSILKEQPTRTKRIGQAFLRFMQSCDPRYIEVGTRQGLYRVKVGDLRRAIENAPSEEPIPDSFKKKVLRDWLLRKQNLMVSTTQIAGQPKLFRKQREQQRAYFDLAILEKPKEQQQKSVESLYNFLSKEGKMKLNLDKLKDLNISQLQTLSRLLFEEFSSSTERGKRIYRAVGSMNNDEEEDPREIVDRVNRYRQIVEEKWSARFGLGKDVGESKERVLSGQGDTREEAFVNWCLEQRSSKEDEESPHIYL